MDDNKEKVTPENPEETIKDEMEELAKVFKEELDKAKAEAEADVESLEVDGYNPREVSVDEKAKMTEDKELCLCCGEKPAKHGDYCSQCDKLLRKAPYDYKGIIAVIAVISITVAAIFCFAINVPIFSVLKQGDKEYNEGNLFSALYKYDEAIYLVANSGSEKVYSNIYVKSAITNFEMVNMGTAVTQIENNIPESVLKLLTFKKANDIIEETELMQATAMIAQQHLAVYPSEITKEVYEQIIADLDNLSGKEIYIVGSNYYDETVGNYVPDGTEKVVICHEGWLNIYKYAAAQQYGAEPKVIAEYLQACADSSEYMKTLVGSILATTYAGMGEYDKAEAIANDLRDINNESIEPYMIMAAIYRYRDNDYDKAIATCDDGVEMLKALPYSESYVTTYSYMVRLQKALSLVMQEKYDEAYEEIAYVYETTYYSGQLTAATRDLYAMLALETGDEEAFNDVKEEIESYESDSVKFTDDVVEYQAGRLTIKEIVESGGYDLV